MNINNPKPCSYQGFEQGPIRPPSEAYSLLVRVTRNCPWNRCTFCPVYKTAKFSLRTVDDVKRDIDLVYKYVRMLLDIAERTTAISRHDIQQARVGIEEEELPAFYAAYNWLFAGGMKSVFLQDANSLIIKPARLVDILSHLKIRFPEIERITSYGRSDTIARKKHEDLRAIRNAGLDRIHIGLESGSDEVLALVKKGVTKDIQIEAGRKVKRAGMELSEYIMPGLGGRALSETHALETADALNRINPDFIRLRTLAIPGSAPLAADHGAGRFQKCTDLMVVREISMLLENLDGITSYVASDHILNLFSDFEGRLPDDKPRLAAILSDFLSLEVKEQCLYRVGRRLGILSQLSDLDDPSKRARSELACRRLGVTPENVDAVTEDLMRRFV